MNVKILTLVIVLLASLLCSGSAGPMTSTEPGRPLEEGVVRKVAQPSPVRSAQSHRPAGWKRRRPRPRLSHKGPMPF
ncbi:apelin isoform X2 [Anguilla anguilla]|uniref:apelin isoform X2 n=1 Tax=Anguilla anguilla TaxID=7936 RepID=UPI0015AE3F46|nr:apelin isoform X2 [Anguilla anguilla]